MGSPEHGGAVSVRRRTALAVALGLLWAAAPGQADQPPALITCQGSPFFSNGVLLVPLVQAFGWCGVTGQVGPGPLWRANAGGKAVSLAPRAGQRTAEVDGVAVPLPVPLAMRDYYYGQAFCYAPLSWIAELCGWAVKAGPVPSSRLLVGPGPTQLLPLAPGPYDRLGVCLAAGPGRGATPPPAEVTRRARAAVERKLQAQGVQLTTVGGVAAGLAAGLPAVLELRYDEQPQGRFYVGRAKSPVAGTLCRLTLLIHEPGAGPAVSVATATGAHPPYALSLDLGSAPTAAAAGAYLRRVAVNDLLGTLESPTWQIPPCRHLWQPVIAAVP